MKTSTRSKRRLTTRRQLRVEKLQDREMFAADLGQTPAVEFYPSSNLMNGTEVSLEGSDVVFDSALEVADVDIDSNGVIRVIGTQGDDFVLIESQDNGHIRVQVNDQLQVVLPNRPVRVFTGAGDDQVVIRGGHPVFVDSGRGEDLVLGGNGDDRLFGGPGNDRILGGGGYDLLDGGGGDDTLAGGMEDDVVGGGRGNDRLDGGDGNDRLVGGYGSDTLIGAAGDDVLQATYGEHDCLFRDWTRKGGQWHSTTKWILCRPVASDEDRDVLIGGDGNDIGSLATQEGDVAVDVTSNAQDDDPTLSYDVNGDGSVNAGDVRAIVNQLNESPPASVRAEGETSAQYDVSGDGVVSPLDALRIINHLHAVSQTESELEVADDELPAAPGENSLDVNRSGTTDHDDARLIREHIENIGLSATTPETERFDTNQDGYISPVDLLIVNNALTRSEAPIHREFIAATDELLADHDEIDDLAGSLSSGFVEEVLL